MSRKPDLGLAIWCRLPCFTRWVHYVNCAQMCRASSEAWHYSLPPGEQRQPGVCVSRRLRSQDPKASRPVPLWVDYTGTSGPTSSGLGQEWSSVRIPNGRICRMIGFLFKHGDMSISLWHWQGLVEGECQEATGRTDLSIDLVFIL